MGDVINIFEATNDWDEILSVEGKISTLNVFRNNRTGEVDIVMLNDDNEAVSITLSPEQRSTLMNALK